MIIDSGSFQETQQRLGTLYEKHHDWLMAVAFNQSKNLQVAEDLVGELYLYLGEKNNHKLYYRDSFNLLYCHNFISSRYINYIKRQNRSSYIEDTYEKEDIPYDVDYDKKLQLAYDTIKKELDDLSKTRNWSSAKLYEMYAFTDVTMEELSTKIGISKSTVFLNIKKIKKHLKDKIENPFKDEGKD
tara:strand:- start:4449 stop:5006 length:558 start_codon:yes stop_codon:yes gene_type:complete